jgi:polysaccharide biosynthesis protein PslH
MILSVMSLPPVRDGHGGSQRAWHLINALAKIGPVDLALIHASTDSLAAGADLEPARALVRSITRIPITAWSASWHIVPRMPKRIGRWIDLVRMGSVHVPAFDRRTLTDIAARLPRLPELVFAGRLPAAVIVDDLIDRGLMSPGRKFVDFDDVQSRFQEREAAAERRRLALDKLLADRLLVARTRRAENRIGSRWDAISVCSAEDVAVVADAQPDARVFRIPNVVDKPLLEYVPGEPFTVLFVGNLSFGPNLQGIRVFIEKAWPLIRASGVEVRLQVVGLNPSAALRDIILEAGADLHANVPSVSPYYARADAVIAPIMFGGGTRVKILEAMAYGRPVVATTIGAEGLGAEHGKHLLIADDMPDFAGAIVRLASDRDLCRRLARNARILQQENFCQKAMDDSVRTMLAAGGVDPERMHGPDRQPE